MKTNSLYKQMLLLFALVLTQAVSPTALAADGDPVERMRLRMESVVGEDLADKSVSIYNGADIELLTFKAAKEVCNPTSYDNCVIIVSQLVVKQRGTSIPKPVKTWCASEVLLTRSSDRYVNTVALRSDESCRYSEVIY